MNIDKTIAEESINDFNNATNFDKESYVFNYNGNILNLFPPSEKSNLLAMDQIILQGHYMYYQNEQFRRAYIDAFGGELNIKSSDMRELFTRNIFYVLLYGMVVSKYVENMKDVPLHYLHRPIEDEKNPDKGIFLTEEHKVNPKYRYEGDASPFCHYMVKKSLIIKPTIDSGFKEGEGVTIICPIKSIVPNMKQFMINYKKFAEIIFAKLNTLGGDDKNFAKLFIDSSWSPYLESN